MSSSIVTPLKTLEPRLTLFEPTVLWSLLKVESWWEKNACQRMFRAVIVSSLQAYYICQGHLLTLEF